MKVSRRSRWIRLGLSIWLFGLMACTYTDCSCGPKAQAPLTESQKLYDAVQLRLTPHGISFIQDHVITRLTELVQEGMIYQITRTEMEECTPGTGWPCFDIVTCEHGCTIAGQINNVIAQPAPPNKLQLTLQVAIQGLIDLSGSFDCEIPINLNKTVPATVELFMDQRDHTLAVDVAPIDITITNDDYAIQCPWWYDWLLEAMKDRITEAINEELHDQLTTALDDVLTEVNCLPCDFYRSGCPSPSTCDKNSGYCIQGGTCRVRPLGEIGQLPPLGPVTDNMPGMRQNPDMFLAVSQWQDTASDPLVVNRGVTMRLVGGLSGQGRAACVPAPHPTEIPSSAPPARYAFTDLAPNSGTPYMAGVVVSEQFLDWMLYKAHLAGMLCFESQDDETNSGTLAAVVNSINVLSGEQAVPLKIVLVPTRVPSITIGAGTFDTNDQSDRVIDQPLITVDIPGLRLDFYTKLNERFVRVMAFQVKAALELSIDFSADNRLIPILKDKGVRLDLVEVSDQEMLAEPPTAIETIATAALELMASEVALTLEMIELPAADGFQMVVQSVTGVNPRPGTDQFDFLGIFGGLSEDETSRKTLHTQAEVVQVLAASMTPPGDDDGLRLTFPGVRLRVGTNTGPEAEYSWRVDEGMWHEFRPGPELVIRDARLLLPGEHAIEVRARTKGVRSSLDPEPMRIIVDLEQEQNELQKVDNPSTTESTVEKKTSGCAHAHDRSTAGWMLLLFLILARLNRARKNTNVRALRHDDDTP